ncbi:LysR family transcriptional regulator [Bradyrhizobium archetypum]|uniref:LysR family transcriptional regulator n=1 Tax=Bradyrhizobium archetypum TaxID=2721160 RepID=A0A7Y4HA12_9BRAD|nr:LysR family transcriptional regulator [Bradyrhizobium archetypum]
MRKIPPFTALRAFEALSRHESLTQAAAELNVSHSAVSQQLRLLEGYFSCKLVRKTGNRIELTPAARSYLMKYARASICWPLLRRTLPAPAPHTASASTRRHRLRCDG